MKSRRKQNKWAARGGPGFIGGDRPAAASPNALGGGEEEDGAPDFNECKASVRVLGGGRWSQGGGGGGDFHRRLVAQRRMPGLEGRAL